MYEVQYKASCRQLERKFRDTEDAISDFTEDDVIFHDEDIKTPLNEIKTRYFAFETELKILALILMTYIQCTDVKF